MSFKTLKSTKLEEGYEKIEYVDKTFYKKFVETDEWWNLESIPGTHDYFDLKTFLNHLKVYSMEHNNPPVVEFSVSVRTVNKLREPPFIQTHEDSDELLYLNDIIGILSNYETHFGMGFVYNAVFICKINKKKVRKRTHIPKGMRHEVFKRDNYTCVECGAKKEDGATLHVDHIIPVSKGGSDELDNLQTLCFDCNLNKSNIIQKGNQK